MSWLTSSPTRSSSPPSEEQVLTNISFEVYSKAMRAFATMAEVGKPKGVYGSGQSYLLKKAKSESSGPPTVEPSESYIALTPKASIVARSSEPKRVRIVLQTARGKLHVYFLNKEDRDLAGAISLFLKATAPTSIDRLERGLFQIPAKGVNGGEIKNYESADTSAQFSFEKQT